MSLDIYAGEVLALVGDNGAGKSTLTRIISGFEKPDSGEVSIDGKHHDGLSLAAAHEIGIEAVPQDLAICDNLSAAMNVVLGRPPLTWCRIGKLGVIDRRRAEEMAREHIGSVGALLNDYTVPIRRFSGGQRQAIAIGRALMRCSRMIIFDEPTAALGSRQRKSTLNIVRKTAQSGVATLLISHNLDDVLAVADRVVALRLGEIVLDVPASSTSFDEVRQAMEGG